MTEPAQKPPTAAEILAQGIPVGGGTLPDPIGVPANYSAVVRAQGPTTTGSGLGYDVEIPPRYFEGDDWAPASLPVEQRAMLQRQMAAAGVIPEGATYRLGVWDETSRQAYRQLLSFANGAGAPVEQALNQWATSKSTTTAPKTQPYLAPDYATLAQQVKGIVSQRLGGREPTQQELDVLVQRMRTDDRAAYDASVSNAQATADGATTVQDVDPSARFTEFFEQRYRPEIEHRKAVNDMTNLRATFLGNADAMTSLIRGAA